MLRTQKHINDETELNKNEIKKKYAIKMFQDCMLQLNWLIRQIRSKFDSNWSSIKNRTKLWPNLFRQHQRGIEDQNKQLEKMNNINL